MFDDCASRDAFRLAAESGRLGRRGDRSPIRNVRWSVVSGKIQTFRVTPGQILRSTAVNGQK